MIPSLVEFKNLKSLKYFDFHLNFDFFRAVVPFLVIGIWSVFGIYVLIKSAYDKYRYFNELYDEDHIVHDDQGGNQNENVRNRNAANPHRRPINVENECPVCLHNIVNPVELTCFHKFWAQCILNIWEHTNAQIKCPMCRNSVNIIFYDFEHNEQNRPLTVSINRYNRIYSENRSILGMLYDLPYIIRRWFTMEGLRIIFISIRILMPLVVALLYLISPFDIIPESVFGLLGLIDDIILLIFIFVIVSQSFINAYIRQQ